MAPRKANPKAKVSRKVHSDVVGESSEGYRRRADCEINAIRNGMPVELAETVVARRWAARYMKSE